MHIVAVVVVVVAVILKRVPKCGNGKQNPSEENVNRNFKKKIQTLQNVGEFSTTIFRNVLCEY